MDALTRRIYDEISLIPLIDPHTHIDPLRPVARNLDEILGYHYFTELAHSCGLGNQSLGNNINPVDRVRSILGMANRFANTIQFQWFVDILQHYFEIEPDFLARNNTELIIEKVNQAMSKPDWQLRVIKSSNIQAVFLTNEFDDPLDGFDTSYYVPCLRADDLVFKFGSKEVRNRLAKFTGVDVGDLKSLKKALSIVFDHFLKRGAKACAISLPPSFSPSPVEVSEFEKALKKADSDSTSLHLLSKGIFWQITEQCLLSGLPFDLMIGVNRTVYRQGVYQGQDLFDGRVSLIQYADLFNSFPGVTFCVSVLSSGLNQELSSYSWIFPNVVTFGHWWYSNIPVLIENDLRLRLEAVPIAKQIGYYSDMYKFEFALPKFNMFRRALAKVLTDNFVREHRLNEDQAIDAAKQVLLFNSKRVFHL